MAAILFDVDDTLYDQMELFATACRETFGEQPGLDMEELFGRSRHYSDVVFEASQRGEITMEAMYIYRLQMPFRDFGIEISADEALAMQARYAWHQQHLSMSPVMADLLTACHAKAALGIITNGPSAHQWSKIHALQAERWIAREHTFVSGDLGIIKPDPQIFVRAAASFPQEDVFWYVGDSWANDICGAKAAGWKTVWLNRRRAPLPATGKADFVVTNEAELQKLIKRLY